MIRELIVTPSILLAGVCVTNFKKRNLSVAFSVCVLTVFILQGETQSGSSNSQVPTFLKFSR